MFILDFDDTLFDTHAHKRARLLSLEPLGVSEETYWETYREARNGQDGLFTYSNERHAEMLGRKGHDAAAIRDALDRMTEPNVLSQFLFSDVIPFLHDLKKKKQTVVLLSLGDPSYQEMKVRGAGIHEFFDRVFFVDQGKAEVLNALLGHAGAAGACLINDKVQESVELQSQFPRMSVLLKQSDSIPEEEYANSGLRYFETISDIHTYVQERFF